MKSFAKLLGLLLIVIVANVATLLVVLDHPSVTLAGADDCLAAQGNLNGDDIVNVADAIYLLSYLFEDGPAPVACAAASELDEDEVDALKELLTYIEVVKVDDPESDDPDDVFPTILLTECNLQLVNGLGATNGAPDDICAVGSATETNGLGNLIVGYNELRNQTENPDDEECDQEEYVFDERGGSHNLVVGSRHNYSSFGGVVFGRTNETSGPYTTVTGGFENEASLLCATVTGGMANVADGGFSSVVGGRNNVAEAFWSVVVGGGESTSVDGNVSRTAYSVVVGGMRNESQGLGAVVVGGDGNEADGENAVTVGGQDNNARARVSVVSGGQDRDALDTYDWVAGSLEEDE